jgi:hypothetical protein
MRLDRIIQKRIRRRDGGVRLDMSLNARIAANIDRERIGLPLRDPETARPGTTETPPGPTTDFREGGTS